MCTATVYDLIAGTWRSDASQGVTLTANAFSTLLGPAGTVVVFVCVLCFATTTMFTTHFMALMRQLCFRLQTRQHVPLGLCCLYRANRGDIYRVVVSLIDGSFALMAIPTMVSAIWLAPKVLRQQKFTLPSSTPTTTRQTLRRRSANNPPNKNNKRLPDPTLENSDQREAHDLQPYLSIWPNPGHRTHKTSPRTVQRR